jgi:hypothetical protein
MARRTAEREMEDIDYHKVIGQVGVVIMILVLVQSVSVVIAHWKAFAFLAGALAAAWPRITRIESIRALLSGVRQVTTGSVGSIRPVETDSGGEDSDTEASLAMGPDSSVEEDDEWATSGVARILRDATQAAFEILPGEEEAVVEVGDETFVVNYPLFASLCVKWFDGIHFDSLNDAKLSEGLAPDAVLRSRRAAMLYRQAGSLRDAVNPTALLNEVLSGVLRRARRFLGT